jgi:hypothetical protein
MLTARASVVQSTRDVGGKVVKKEIRSFWSPFCPGLIFPMNSLELATLIDAATIYRIAQVGQLWLCDFS